MDTPKVSVILIVRDGAATIRLALTSLLLQTFPDWECIIVNDASTDATREILTGLTDPRFHVWHSREPLGRGKARRLALARTNGLYVATLDADDFYFPRKLEHQVSILDAYPDVVAAVAGLFCFDTKYEPFGRPIGYFSPGKRLISPRVSHLRIPFGGIMFRKDQLHSLSYEDLPRGEDMSFFSRYLMGHHIYIEAGASYGCLWKMDFQDVLLGLQQGVRTYRAMTSRGSIRASLLALYTQGKIWLYTLLWRCGLWTNVNRFRCRRAPTSLEQQFHGTLRSIKQSQHRL